MALTKVTSGAVSGLATSATTDTTDASNITTGTIPTARLDSTLDLSSKTVTLPAASVTAHATNPTKASIEALGIDLPAADLTGTIADARFPSTLPAISGANLTGIETVTKSTSAPSSPAAGDMWFDTTTGTNSMKVWSGSGWDQMSNKFSATGGTESTYSSGGTNYKVHTFTSSGTFTAEASGSVDYLVVAGGGGGGRSGGGGGGAGGFRTATGFSVSAQNYSITVGGGGGGGSLNTIGGQGGNSIFSTITSIGGGGGGSGEGVSGYDGGNGGSGGGSWRNNGSPGSGTAGQGNAAGSRSSGIGGGGGGAGEAGNTDSTAYGGDGLTNNLRTGSNIYYAGGGGAGAAQAAGITAIGGDGGGANGILETGTPIPATANLGGGGGGSGTGDGVPGGSGGSGIVVIRYVV